jgi:SET domain-containing protein
MGLKQTKKEFVKDLKNNLTTHIYAFGLNKEFIVDGSREGNNCRFVNHSCNPNCETYTLNDKLYLYANTEIKRGEELTFDYQLTPILAKKFNIDPYVDYKCNCGSENCRGTMIKLKK